MAQTKFIKKESLSAWLEELGQKHNVLAPRFEGDSIIFRPFDSEKGFFIDREATAPPKKAIFPQSETLLEFSQIKDMENLSKIAMDVKETIPTASYVVFGNRPCDARGFTMFDRVYLNGKNVDVYYKARRENTYFITLACEKGETTCFCNAVGSGPSDPEGSDLLMTPVNDGYYIESVSKRGEELLSSSLLTDGSKLKAEADKYKKAADKSMNKAPDFKGSPEKLLAVFDNPAFWEEMSDKCISCGACTYLCPTCYCFNITDETNGLSGTRIRSWDNCMSPLFTSEASGHNPRPAKANRLRNRVGHKFSYYPELHGGVISCCGCGRCIKSCPAGVDIRQLVLSAISFKPATKKEA
ncbi:4Fe-4S dicluster domain-containing protein [Desulfovibrio gilichinskyi]|uniref:4Fe-4S dicluster containing protein n=1 Tax=Desulfovibrio gilichinskyi TaxID=1519643 RepID=A0A1X7CN95_9BACT|nr:4Fe-4S dicluster domain-containing protein [Desulfovibrio gilichinskyi]SME99916.1 4Fe-4S dicluster containing protein [Desulfovibrio gilichinskyi]